jgi:hypothetical protein
LDNNYANDTLTQTISQALTYPLFNNLQHNFGSAGQTNHKIFYMPDSLNDYSQILLHIDLYCPVGGCDPWDQYARLSLLKDGEAWELARYITPFGKACGGWVFDITDFRSKLVGQVDFESYIQVWGASGWLLNAVIELVPGTPAYKFVKIDKLWNNDYLVYGDPGISYNLTDTLMNIPNNVASAKIRLTSTGHGQGNTSNAAEFYNATHTINVNGVSTFTQNLWKTDCATNSCTAQSGTYTYSRAGWCPGQDVQPQVFDLAGLFTPGQSISLDYVLQPYTNLLNTGYNNGSHTEPYLRVQGYLVSYGNSPLVSIQESEIQNLELNVYPNPAKDLFSVYCKSANSGLVDIKLYDAVGRLYFSKTANHLQGEWYEEISVKDAPMGFYFLKVKSESGIVTKKIILQ